MDRLNFQFFGRANVLAAYEEIANRYALPLMANIDYQSGRSRVKVSGTVYNIDRVEWQTYSTADASGVEAIIYGTVA